ncbi:MAG: hemolysin family protein [Bacteroidia bacterium]|nr:hemolysin family protein [Bacteroidia bacterium]MDW8158313.1 hemolysin family protein [Bacteroidia bacterium]
MQESLVILFLILLNGLFSITEISIISSKKIKLESLAEKGNFRAKLVLELLNSPSSFLSAVQIGITAIGILTGIYSGSTIAKELAVTIDSIYFFKGYGEEIGITIVVVITTYLSLVLGELVPKRIAMAYPESIAIVLGPVLKTVLVAAKPLVWFLSFSTDILLKIAHIPKQTEEKITEEEIKALIEQGTEEGTFTEIEQQIVQRVFLLGDRRVSSLMTPRRDICFLDTNQTPEEHIQYLMNTVHTYLPVCDGSIDRILGVIRTQQLLISYIQGKKNAIKELLIPPLYVPESTRSYTLLKIFQEKGIRMALVVDEFGSIQGLVSIVDIFKSLVGEFGVIENEEKEIVNRPDGSWLVDGSMPFEDFCERVEFEYNCGEDPLPFNTTAGFVLDHLQRIPITGEHFVCNGFYFEVVDMDGIRVDKLLVKKLE